MTERKLTPIQIEELFAFYSKRNVTEYETSPEYPGRVPYDN
jgi:hypothetical protein